jgi:mevalonate kinase
VTDDAQFLRAQARKCRWLAERISSGDVVETLLQMAKDYDERAARKETGGGGGGSSA